MSSKTPLPPDRIFGLKCPRLFWIILPHACLVASLVLYSVIGAFIFKYTEGSGRKPDTEFQGFLLQLWNISQNTYSDSGNVSQKDEFINSTRHMLIQNLKVEWLQMAELEWGFLKSLFFCCTIFTTIGYGHLYPVTICGKIACIIYATVGIPLMLLLLTDLGDILAGLMSKVYKYVLHTWKSFRHKPDRDMTTLSSLQTGHTGKSSLESTLDSRVSMKEPLNLTDVLKNQASVKKKYHQMRNIDLFELIIVKEHSRISLLKCNSFQKSHSCPHLESIPASDSAINNFDRLGVELDQLDVPIILIVFVVVAYIMFGAFILPLWETNWSTIDAFYFCFVTLTTIGFGDIVPTHPNYFLLLSAYTVIGMAIMCMAFKLLQNRMVCFYKQCMSCISRGIVKHESIHHS
ncbi:potassium channel subfamily K member 18 [Pelobates fuscus]|uniref:potassium channel subfamily K member 18 n=1 Tax=Pelobates fuscus TaxID=191477 RepID=UPI002FE4E608